MKCGEVCNCQHCERPCQKKLKCGHPCVGLCGDPCPPLCRTCDNEKLTELLFGDEDEPDSRFIYLEECQHVVEYEGLKNWLHSNRDPEPGESIKVQMKTCPKGCQQPLYNNQRFKNVILQTYQDVQQVLFKFGEQTPTLQNIAEKLMQPKDELFPEEEPRLRHELMFLTSIETSPLARAVDAFISVSRQDAQQLAAIFGRRVAVKKNLPQLSSEKLHLFDFQAEVIRQAFTIRKELKKRNFVNDLDEIVSRVMKQNIHVVQQFIVETMCELERIRYSSTIEDLRGRAYNHEVTTRLALIDGLMDPGKPFTTQTEAKVKALLKQCEKYSGGLGISDKERKEILAAMVGIQKGGWYKCPNGHLYCIGECGGAMQLSKCPECNATIGGEQHRLVADNSVATEMAGATHPAWPQREGDPY